jgi:hypothetical protein
MLNQSQKNKLKNVRSLFRTIPCTLWTITKNTISSNDFYRRPTTITSGSHLFSGSVAWSNVIYRTDSAGGFYKTSEVAIVTSYDEKDYLDSENSYLVCEGVPLRMKNMAQATDTNELVIYCERLNE